MAREMYCPNCRGVGTPKIITKGSIIIELFLWLMMLLPGLLYSLWRLSSRHRGCRFCGSPHMIPIDSPRAEAEMLQAYRQHRVENRAPGSLSDAEWSEMLGK